MMFNIPVMKTNQKSFLQKNLFISWVCMVLAFLLSASIKGYPLVHERAAQRIDSMLIKKQLLALGSRLNYPETVARFYKRMNFQRVWVYPDTVRTPVYHAMLLLDCVLQFGLNRQDFHPNELTYNRLKPLVSSTGMSYSMDREDFDIYMTDAMLTLVNHLHYGKFNPVRTKYALNSPTEDYAQNLLFASLSARDFMVSIGTAQPELKSYKDLQSYLHLVKGQYIDDCYEFPEGEARKIAANMERMRWVDTGSIYYLQINIPSFLLTLHNGDSATIFKVVVGKPTSPSPQLESKVQYLTTAPEWKVPVKIFIRELLPKGLKNPTFLEDNHYAIYDQKGNYVIGSPANLKLIKTNPAGYSMRQSPGCDNAMGKVVFRFPNRFDIYLHDTPEQKLFNKEERAFSHGCIRVEGAEKLASMLLVHDGRSSRSAEMKKSVRKLEKKDFFLRNPIPIKITYFTAEIIDGMLKVYPDIYNLDPGLERQMFPQESVLVKDR
ncbi:MULTISPECIES: L,D-transpeptidase family protein [unclassified Pedobacter]|uniref:L,D-transpeptidase family protein n=1 Tax=unclassified Pedobacter TaxID=2628915 RepID=UPI0014211884|nr:MULTISPECIES: L,D-transpeptidase family protein [unclassified Pedobacter]NII81287.1 murein L,D-transpeptidase YcbB/YkuD [Pedobacter sp. SG908]NMN35293.1 murein L,D-transpeptidase YcbB/YkuD [Pedobacter sp. SG918]